MLEDVVEGLFLGLLVGLEEVLWGLDGDVVGFFHGVGFTLHCFHLLCFFKRRGWLHTGRVLYTVSLAMGMDVDLCVAIGRGRGWSAPVPSALFDVVLGEIKENHLGRAFPGWLDLGVEAAPCY